MPKTIYKSNYRRLVKQLIQARIDCKLTQREVATKLHKTSSFVAKCETGERRLDIIELVYFAKIYNRPISYFVHHIDPRLKDREDDAD